MPPKASWRARRAMLCIRKSDFFSTSNLADKTLEECLSDQKLCALLVATDLTKGYGPRAVTMGLFHAPSVSGFLSCSAFPPVDWCAVCFAMVIVQLSMLFFLCSCVCFLRLDVLLTWKKGWRHYDTKFKY
jgi:hypothetical protein